MAKMTPLEATQWATWAMQMITLGATTYGAIRQATQDAGWPEDDARLVALEAKYQARIARAKAAAAGQPV
jgi:hypothetical protein